MLKKFLVFAAVMVMAAGFSTVAFAEEAAEGAGISIGAHIKLTVFDHTNAINRNGSVQTEINRTYGITFKELDLYVDGRVNDWIGFEVVPRFSQSTGSTPKLGTTYTASASGFSYSGQGHGKAVVTFKLPGDVHMEVGSIHPIFTMEYGKETFWEDEFNVGPFVGAKGPAGAYHDTGIELQKTFDFGDISLPVYFDITNGNAGSMGPDNNNQPGVNLHVEPVWGPLTLGGTFYINRPDAKERTWLYAYCASMILKLENLTIRAEYARGFQEDGVSAGKDLTDEGYFAKALYKVTPWLQLMLVHESYQTNIGVPNKQNRIFKYTPGLQIFLSDSTVIQAGCDIEQLIYRDNSVGGVYTRPSVNLRLTL